MEIKERPILFNADMVNAILAGRKTQTRRIVKPQPPETHSFGGYVIEASSRKNKGKFKWGIKKGEYHFADSIYVRCPYGQPGERLWVREAWGVVSHAFDENGDRQQWEPDRPATPVYEMPFGKGYYHGHVIYAADGGFEWAGDDDGGGEPRSAWKPSIHMPRIASRILLEIVSVRVERLLSISDEDAIAEGCYTNDEYSDMAGDADVWPCQICDGYQVHEHGSLSGASEVDCTNCDSPKKRFNQLWQSINGFDSWGDNSWVWVVEFKVVEQ